MNENDDAPLLSAAAKISSGVPVDWEEITDKIVTSADAAVAEELKSLELLAHIHEQVPTTWGRFAILGEIGRGSFGTVYRAFDPTLQLEVALKVIPVRTPGVPAEAERALEEARRLVKVSHANVVRAYGAESIGNEVGLSMEFINGHTLDEIVKRQETFGAGEASVIGIDLCRALAAVHNTGMLHGDIKAHNVMREVGGRTVLMDFGTGRYLRHEPAGNENDFAGTPIYLAPEVFAGQPRTPASEIYSVGVLLYFLVTAAYPVQGDTRTAIGRQHGQAVRRKPLRDVRPDLPDTFIRVVEQAIAERPEQRYESAGALEAALAHVVAHPAAPPAAHPRPVPVPVPLPKPNWRRLLSIGAAAVAVVALAAIAAQRMSSRLPAEPVAAGASVAAAAASPASSGDYRIETSFYREHSGGTERLTSDTRLALGDALSMQIQASIPLYVYVVNEDERGDSFLLFPLPGHALQNPLPGGRRHRLPAMQNGEPMSWQVTSTGEREHFVIVASPQPSRQFEELFATLPQPTLGRTPIAEKLSLAGIGVLRGIGGLVTSPVSVDRQLRLLPEFSIPLSDSEETAQGVWIRRATFLNPTK